MDKTLLVILGPTASGKTSLAISLAENYRTEVISADSRQLYREIPVGTAAPAPAERARVPHHFVGSISIHDYYNASIFEEQVLEMLDTFFREHDLAIMAGGSGMYIDAVCSGIDTLPAVDPLIREQLRHRYEAEGIEGLRHQLRKLDPETYSRVDLKNPNRILKALEVTIQTGKPYSAFLTAEPKSRPFRILKVGLELPRSELYARINHRVEEMIRSGWIEEAKKVWSGRNVNALNTVGYKELFEYLDGKISLERAIELIQRNTRRFAKRQVTWFKRDPMIHWFHPGSREQILSFIDAELNK